MIVETSALIAIVNGEPERSRFVDAIQNAPDARMSAANYVESGIVIDGTGDPRRSRNLDRLVASLRLEIVAVTPSQARLARAAYREFGKGSGHPARLNFGDCFAYALAVEADEPLLYKGDDFAATGIPSALRP